MLQSKQAVKVEALRIVPLPVDVEIAALVGKTPKTRWMSLRRINSLQRNE